MEKPFNYKKFLQYFLQGLLIMAPVAITIYALFFFVSTVDGWIPIFRYIPISHYKPVPEGGDSLVIPHRRT